MKFFIKCTAPVVGLLGLGLAGCQPDIDAPKVSAGSADFSSYIAIGNSLTAGYSDGGLYREGQLNSYPNILSQQFAQVGGGSFVQPLFTEAQSNGSGYLKLTGFTATGSPVTANVTTSLALRGGTAAAPLYTKFTDPINNLGVPGIRMSDILTPGYGSVAGNPYFERITLDTTPLQTYLQRVQATVASLKPTFFTEWLGNNDVLGYATAGGAASSLTPVATFTTNTGLVLDALVAGGAKGVVSTIPDVTGIPFFTTVGPSFKATLVANSVPGVVALTGAAAGNAASGNRKSIATADIRDASGGRQLFTLTSSAFLGLLGRPTGAPWRYLLAQANQPRAALGPYLTSFGIDTTQAFGATVGNPIPSAFVLDDVEQGLVASATASFNSALTTAATSRNLAIFDANAFFRNVAANGYVANAANNTAGYLSGNLFGLDGVHPTPRGYAVVANEILKVINAKYGSSFQGVNANLYRGVVFP
ncbi:SGNH/GDSL hydrolase family protein [Hymenobacter terricola]|uniref:SGNH/GDSL hydrolase family protein n=1 Tax=Hymenobacter terricola TaxID=2819236 RepID=UPI001B30D4F5|nr:SGNH/GDSL hydrolase family protein [Hymenobacter terricola]